VHVLAAIKQLQRFQNAERTTLATDHVGVQETVYSEGHQIEVLWSFVCAYIFASVQQMMDQ
jgi:hypothetical protein